MSDFGGKLREARERRGVSLRQIAASTKIAVAALEALERNDWSKLPGGIFTRAFVRSYAIEVGLDPEETVREFLEQFEQAPAVAGPAPVREEDGSFESQQQMAGVVLKLVIIAVPLIGVILYFTLRNRPAAERTVPAAQVEEAPSASAPPARPTPPTADTTPALSQPMRLELHPRGPCWVTLTVDGRRVFSRLLQAGDREVHEVRDAAVIDIGDAGAFAFSVNGRPGRSLGTAGQVLRDVRITRDTLADLIR